MPRTNFRTDATSALPSTASLRMRTLFPYDPIDTDDTEQSDTEVTDTSCELGAHPPCIVGDALCHARRDFFFEQYYNSYGTARPVMYPWTSLGYTFDWAPGTVGLGGKVGFVVQIVLARFIDDLGERFTEQRLYFKKIKALARFGVYGRDCWVYDTRFGVYSGDCWVYDASFGV